MADKWDAGLTDQDELRQFPSAASPLSALGLDPDVVRANPSILESLNNPEKGAVRPSDTPQTSGPVSMPAETRSPSASTVEAAKLGGAGAESVTNAPPVASTPATTTPAPAPPAGNNWYDFATRGLQGQESNVSASAEAARAIPTTSPEIEELDKRAAALRTQGPVFDPQTGQRLRQTTEPIYNPKTGQVEQVPVNPSPSRGQRIWRGVRGGLTGFSIGGIPGAVIGAVNPQMMPGGQTYGAPSSAYQHLEETRTGQLAGTEADAKEKLEDWKQQVTARTAQGKDLRDTAAANKDLVSGAVSIPEAQAKTTEAGARQLGAENQTPEEQARKQGLITQAEFDQRERDLASDPQLKRASNLQRIFYKLTGKLPEPHYTSEADNQASAVARATVAFRNSHGSKSPQTLEDYNSIQEAARGNLDKGSGGGKVVDAMVAKKNAAVQKANYNFVQHPSDIRAYAKELQEAQNAFEEDAARHGVGGDHQVITVDDRGHVTWTPTQQSAPAPAATAPTGPPPGATHQVKSRADGKMHWTNSQANVDLGVVQ
jgi:hypothetical protein